MSIYFESKLKNLPSDHRLDIFFSSFNDQETPLYPSDGFIISRNSNGSILSQYYEDIWDLTPYHKATGKCRLKFKNKSTEKISDSHIKQMKWFLICLMYLTPSALSTTTVVMFLAVIRDLALYCHENNIPRLADIFSNYKELKKYITDAKLSTKSSILLLQIMSHLSMAGSKVTGISITNSLKITKLNTHLQKIRKDNLAQTLPIPSRIYLIRINQLKSALDEFLIHKQEILLLLRKCLEDTNYGLSLNMQSDRGRGKSQRVSTLTGKPCLPFLPDFTEALSNCGLSKFSQKHGFYSRQSFSAFITRLRYICKHQIHLFSGMRHDEVKLLRFGSLTRESMLWGDSFFLTGITTKIHKSRKLSRWVTSIDVKPAIELAEAITGEIAEHLDYKPEGCSLFIPHSLIRNVKRIPKPDECINFELNKYNPISVHIKKTDLTEIERILIDVDWGKYPDIKVGKTWPFKYHQYRRSLAIYGSNSGLIELSSLKYQLKHITDSMTMYYSKGSQRAMDILGVCHGEHFMHEYSQQKPITDTLVFIRDYLMSNEALGGGQGIILDKYLTINNTSIIKEERHKTEKRFKQGEIAFKETPLGACTSTEKCDSRLNIVFTSCISCPQAILKLSKVDKFINEIEISLQNLTPESVEYRLERSQLKDLKRLKTKMKRS